MSITLKKLKETELKDGVLYAIVGDQSLPIMQLGDHSISLHDLVVVVPPGKAILPHEGYIDIFPSTGEPIYSKETGLVLTLTGKLGHYILENLDLQSFISKNQSSLQLQDGASFLTSIWQAFLDNIEGTDISSFFNLKDAMPPHSPAPVIRERIIESTFPPRTNVCLREFILGEKYFLYLSPEGLALADELGTYSPEDTSNFITKYSLDAEVLTGFLTSLPRPAAIGLVVPDSYYKLEEDKCYLDYVYDLEWNSYCSTYRTSILAKNLKIELIPYLEPEVNNDLLYVKILEVYSQGRSLINHFLPRVGVEVIESEAQEGSLPRIRYQQNGNYRNTTINS